MFIRTVRVRSSSGVVHEYVRIVESYRDDRGQSRQRVVADLGRKDLLTQFLPQLVRLLRGEELPADAPPDVQILQAVPWGPILLVRWLFDQLGLWEIFDRHLGSSHDGVSYADRACVLLANRLIAPKSEHALARFLETDFVCDRLGRRFTPSWKTYRRVKVDFRQLRAWYRTLDRLIAAKDEIELALYHRLRDLFSIRPDLILYDLTSTYFEGQGPEDFAKYGYSRDGKSQNVQVVIGLVMVDGWPIAHHVWSGNRKDVETVDDVVQDLSKRFDFQRVLFVGDRGMYSEENIETLKTDHHQYLLGLKRRRNPKVSKILESLNEERWEDCPVGIAANEKQRPPRTRVQEVKSETEGQRIFVIDSEERRNYETAKRQQAMGRVRERLERLRIRVEKGRLKDPTKIGEAAGRILQKNHGHRYYTWQLQEGVFRYEEHPIHFEREKRMEGIYLIETNHPTATAQQVVEWYKDLMEVERGFRNLKDVLELRPIHHQKESRVKAHILVAAMSLLLQIYLERRLKEAKTTMNAEEAMEAMRSLSRVSFQVGEEERWGVSQGSERARRILNGLKIRELRPPAPPADQETVL